MLINYEETEHVKFVNYTGKYPNLCNGVLTLNIDGEDVLFGHAGYNQEIWKTDGNFDSFWISGGSCGFRNSYKESYVHENEWEIHADLLPEKYKKYALEIDRVFNENVEYGCCGGCL